MTTDQPSGASAPATFTDANLRGARFVDSDLSGAVMRGVDIADAEIESPWLFEGGSLRVNGVDVVPLVDAELNRRFPGRAERRAGDPEGLRSAWAKLEAAWQTTLEHVTTLPPGTVDVSIGDEWTFAQTLRHLIYATDVWLGKAILDVERPPHPIGLSHGRTADETSKAPGYAEVLDVRAGRVAMVRDFLATVTPATLARSRPNPHDPQHSETVLSCLHTILEEEWEHHRYARRDLDATRTGG